MKNRKLESVRALKKWGIVLAGVTTAALLMACGSKAQDSIVEEDTTVTIGVVGEAQEMWVPVIEELEQEGITVELVTFTDYATPNAALAGGEVDLNAFQHHAYLNKEIENYGYEITAIGDTFISAMNIYSAQLTDISQVKEGDKVAVPNDATNEGRALKILEAAGLIKLDEAAGDSPEVSDILENPLQLELVEVDAANVYALLPDVAIAVINCNYALDSGLNPGEDSIFQDNVNIYSNNNYVNLIAARKGDENKEVYQRVVEAYQSEAVKAVYVNEFKGSYIAAWE